MPPSPLSSVDWQGASRQNALPLRPRRVCFRGRFEWCVSPFRYHWWYPVVRRRSYRWFSGVRNENQPTWGSWKPGELLTSVIGKVSGERESEVATGGVATKSGLSLLGTQAQRGSCILPRRRRGQSGTGEPLYQNRGNGTRLGRSEWKQYPRRSLVRGPLGHLGTHLRYTLNGGYGSRSPLLLWAAP